MGAGDSAQAFSGNPAQRFQPGVSGNPTGRPKTFSIHQHLPGLRRRRARRACNRSEAQRAGCPTARRAPPRWPRGVVQGQRVVDPEEPDLRGHARLR